MKLKPYGQLQTRHTKRIMTASKHQIQEKHNSSSTYDNTATTTTTTTTTLSKCIISQMCKQQL